MFQGSRNQASQTAAWSLPAAVCPFPDGHRGVRVVGRYLRQPAALCRRGHHDWHGSASRQSLCRSPAGHHRGTPRASRQFFGDKVQRSMLFSPPQTDPSKSASSGARSTTRRAARREPFLIAEPADLDQNVLYAKERRLIELVQEEVKKHRGIQIYATYTQKRDVTRRLEAVLLQAGIKTAVLTTQTPPEQREAWYERQLKAGVQAFIAHPRLVQTGARFEFLPGHHLVPDRIFHFHAPAGEPSKLENRANPARDRAVLVLCGNRPGWGASGTWVRSCWCRWRSRASSPIPASRTWMTER